MAQAHAGEQRFGKLTVRPAQRQLLVDGQPATVGARALDLLLALIERRERVVAKNELLDLVWPGLVVEENNLQVQISSLRKLLGPQVITTIPGRGYRFTATSPGAAAAERPISDAVLGRRAGDTLPERNSNLGEPATLLGRDADLAALVPLVTAHRAVTVVGAGGIGKTRLAQAAGHALRDVFTDGVWLVELAPLSDPQFVAAAAAQALGLSLPGHRPIFDELVEALRERAALLVLDNCEHVVEAASTLAQALLERTAGVHVLATSQELLRLPEEHLYRLGPLAVPAHNDLQEAANCGAVILFVARLAAQRPSFELDQDNLADVTDICRRLDGLPLAIELAAARAAQLGVRSVHERLNERLRMLTGGARLALRRHQTLREMLDFSHGLLSADERVIFRRAGVFAGGFTLPLAQQVLSDERIDEWAVLDHLGALVDKSLVVADPGEPPRYRLLETMRAYALEKLREAGETDHMLLRHAQAMRALMEQFVDQEWTVPTQLRVEQALPELDNLRAALQWSAQSPGQAELHLALAGASGDLWRFSDLRHEGVQWLAQARGRIDSATPSAIEARLKTSAAILSFPDASELQREISEQAVRLYRQLGDRRGLSRALWAKVRLTGVSSEPEACQNAVQELADVHDPSWPPISKWFVVAARLWALWHAMSNTESDSDRRQLASMREAYQECLNLATEFGDTVLRRISLMYLEQAAQLMESYEEAARLGRELIAEMRSGRFPGLYASMQFSNLCLALTQLGRLDEALEVGRECLKEGVKSGLLWWHLDVLALLAARRKRFTQAAKTLGRADVAMAGKGRLREPNEQRAREQTLAMLREALPQGELERLFAQGAGLTDEQAARLALDG